MGTSLAYATTFTDDTLHVSAPSGLPSGSDAVFFTKPIDPTNSVRYTFNNVGGAKTDGGGGAFWRGLQLAAPRITVDESFVFPRLTTYAEYDSMTDPSSRLWIIDSFNSEGPGKSHDIVYRISGQTILYLDNSGNVGVGTTTPSEKLDVSGNIQLTGNIVSPNDICIGNCP